MKRKHILNMLVQDEPGTLIRIAGLIWRRGFNIDTITVGKTEIPKISRIVISLTADEHVVEQVTKQVGKLIPVLKISELKEQDSVIGELCYIKIQLPENRDDILRYVENNKAELINLNHTHAVIQITGDQERIDKFINGLKANKMNIARTGLTGISK